MRRVGQTKIGNLSFFLGGKAESDGPQWAPDLQAVRAVIKFAMDTKRLDMTRPDNFITNYNHEPNAAILTLNSLELVDRASAAEDSMLNTWRKWPLSRPARSQSREARPISGRGRNVGLWETRSIVRTGVSLALWSYEV
jgi:hypothetical protein